VAAARRRIAKLIACGAIGVPLNRRSVWSNTLLGRALFLKQRLGRVEDRSN
jgi:hypothetical protein